MSPPPPANLYTSLAVPRLFILTILEIEKCSIVGLTKFIGIFVTLYLIHKLRILIHVKNILIHFTITGTVPVTKKKKRTF